MLRAEVRLGTMSDRRREGWASVVRTLEPSTLYYRPPIQGGPPASSQSSEAKLASVLEIRVAKVGFGTAEVAEPQE